jgi:hypothetical protein
MTRIQNQLPLPHDIKKACIDVISEHPDTAREIKNAKLASTRMFYLGFLSGKTIVKLNDTGFATGQINVRNDITALIVKLIDKE